MFDPYYRLHNLIFEPNTDLTDVAYVFNRLDLTHKVEAVNSLKGGVILQGLWDKAAPGRQIEVEDLVPATVKPMEAVVFHCHGSQRTFPSFNMICCRPPVLVGNDTLWGYSETYSKPVIGPGYYTVHNSLVSEHGSVAFDYTMVPPEAPADWPRIRPNNIGLGKRIYDGLVTYVRAVADDVYVAAHTRDERETGTYFAMVRLL